MEGAVTTTHILEYNVTQTTEVFEAGEVDSSVRGKICPPPSGLSNLGVGGGGSVPPDPIRYTSVVVIVVICFIYNKVRPIASGAGGRASVPLPIF